MGVTSSVSPRTPVDKSPNWLVQNECSLSKGEKLTLQYVLNLQLQIDALSFTTNKPNTRPYTPPSWIEKELVEEKIIVGQDGNLPLPRK
ncbi:MAG: hypothetical protein ACI9YL_001990 [Luteibaculaceae bacterium]|jgi:hypothetical protein